MPIARRLAVLATAAVLLTRSAGPAFGQDGARRDDRPEPAAPKAPVLTRPPELLEAAQPVYPPAALAEGLEADVTVQITIDATGQVTDAKVTTPAGHGFDEAAVEAARRYRFRPAELDGKPAPIVVETTIRFRAGTEIAPPPAPGPATDVRPAGTLTVRGVVKERGTRRLLAGVAVAVAGVEAEAVTAPDGTFALEGLAPGRHRIVALAPGFDRFSDTITLDPGESAEVAIYLRPRGGNPYETVVSGDRERLEVTRRTLERRELVTVPGTFGDPIRVIQNLPGLARSPFASGFLLIRGSNPDDSGVFVDGHRVPLLFHFLGGPSILNPEFLGELHLYPGGYPARFGRQLAGIVEVETRSTATDGVHGSADVDLIDASAYVRTPVGRGVTFAAAARRSYIDALLPFVIDVDPGETLVVVPVYWDYQARLDAPLPDRARLSVLAFGSDDRLDVLSQDPGDEEAFQLNSAIGFHRLRVAYERPLGRGLALTISPVLGRDFFSIGGGEDFSVSATSRIAGLRERIRGSLGERVRVDFGADLEYRLTTYRLNVPIASDVRPPGEEVEFPNELIERTADHYLLGLHGEVALEVGDLRVIPGLRLDTYLLGGEARASVDPRLVLRYGLDDRTQLKAYGGLFHQPPQPEGFDPVFGNPELGLERAYHTGVGVERKLRQHLTLDAELYYVRRDDLAVFTDEVRRLPDGTFEPVFWANESEGRSYGLEVLLRHEVTRNFYGWLAYTLSRSTVRRAPDQPFILTAFDQTHNAIAVASYRTDGGWELGARMRVVTGRPETPILGSTYEADEDDYDPVRGPLRSARRPLFHQLDVRLEKTWLFRTWMLGSYLDVQNVYNAENPEATQWDYRFRRSAPVRGVPFLPTLGVRGQW